MEQFFIDIDDYTSTSEQDSTDIVSEYVNEYSSGNPGWGENPQGITLNVYSNPGFFPYYGFGFNRFGFGFNRFGFGFNRFGFGFGGFGYPYYGGFYDPFFYGGGFGYGFYGGFPYYYGGFNRFGRFGRFGRFDNRSFAFASNRRGLSNRNVAFANGRVRSRNSVASRGFRGRSNATVSRGRTGTRCQKQQYKNQTRL